MSMKKIDVVIPAYKAHGTLPRALGSIITQSIVNDLKVVVVNDADDKDYSDIVSRFAPFVDIEEIRLDVNGGPGVARQAGIDHTNSPYFTCIDADDTFASPFALETLLSNLQAEPNYHTCIGGFVEQHPPLNFLNHQQDMVWMFGKLYTRAFTEKYNVRFNATRANEDNGFNTIIRLVSSETEKIKFIPDIVYYWHFKEDSITRINNAEYSYNQSFPGYAENMAYAIEQARKAKPFNPMIDMWAVQVMAQLYVYYLQTEERAPKFAKQNYEWCLNYYKRIFGPISQRITMDSFKNIFSEVLVQQAPNMVGVIPSMTIYQFIEKLKAE